MRPDLSPFHTHPRETTDFQHWNNWKLHPYGHAELHNKHWQRFGAPRVHYLLYKTITWQRRTSRPTANGISHTALLWI